MIIFQLLGIHGSQLPANAIVDGLPILSAVRRPMEDAVEVLGSQLLGSQLLAGTVEHVDHLLLREGLQGGGLLRHQALTAGVGAAAAAVLGDNDNIVIK